jgi:hypothetical protein
MIITSGLLVVISITGLIFLVITLIFSVKWSEEKSKTLICSTTTCPLEGIQQNIEISGFIFKEYKVIMNFKQINTNVSDVVINIERQIDTENLVATISKITATSAILTLTRMGNLPNVYNIEARIANNSGTMTNFLQVIMLRSGYGFIVPDSANGGARWFYADEISKNVINKSGFLIVGNITMIPTIVLVDNSVHIIFTTTDSKNVFLSISKNLIDFEDHVTVPLVALYENNSSVIGTVQSIDRKVSGLLYQAPSSGAATFDLNVAISLTGFKTIELIVKVTSVLSSMFFPMFEIQQNTGKVFIGVARDNMESNFCDIWVSETIDAPEFKLLYTVMFSESLFTSVQWYLGSFSDGVIVLLSYSNTGENKLFTSSDNFTVGETNLVTLDAEETAQKLILSFLNDNGIKKVFVTGDGNVNSFFVQYQYINMKWTGTNLLPRKEASMSTSSFQISDGLALQAMYASTSGITSIGLIGGTDKHNVNFSIVSEN